MTAQRLAAAVFIPLLVASTQLATAEDALIDFSNEDLRHEWMTANDAVMGGKSRGAFELKEDHLFFNGTIVTDGGGFASVRTKDREWKIEGGDGLALKCRGDGRTYRLEVRTDARWGFVQVSYAAEFKTTKDQWIEVKIPFEKLQPQMFGNPVDEPFPEEFTPAKIRAMGMDRPFDESHRKLDPTKIKAIGFKLYDKKDGSFEFSLKNVSLYEAAEEEEPAEPSPENWTSNDNRTIKATALSYDHEKKTVTLRLANGKTSKVPLSRLNAESQARILSRFPEE